MRIPVMKSLAVAGVSLAAFVAAPSFAWASCTGDCYDGYMTEYMGGPHNPSTWLDYLNCLQNCNTQCLPGDSGEI